MPPRQSQRLNHTGYLSTGKYTPHTSTTIVDEVLTARANKLLHWGRDGHDCSLPVDRVEIGRGRALALTFVVSFMIRFSGDRLYVRLCTCVGVCARA